MHVVASDVQISQTENRRVEECLGRGCRTQTSHLQPVVSVVGEEMKGYLRVKDGEAPPFPPKFRQEIVE